MHQDLTLAVLQYSPLFGELNENIRDLLAQIDSISADLLVLPELCMSGYSFLTREEAIQMASKSEEVAALFSPWCKNNNGVLVGGFVEKTNDHIYNSSIIVYPDGSWDTYRKTHLFYKEKLCFDRGNTGFKVFKHPVIDLKFGVMICYDWRFPEAARTMALAGADVIVVPANLISNAWEKGLPARALENFVYLCLSNRAGHEIRKLEDDTQQVLDFTGNSKIYDPRGEVISSINGTESGVIYASMNVMFARNKQLNEYNHIFEDRQKLYYF